MKLSLSILSIIILTNSGCTQPTEFKKFVDSFKKERTDQILDFGRIVQTSNPMTKREALLYVYQGDTIKLYCNHKIFSMETEKVEGISRELFLPSKCLRLDLGGYYLVAYTSYDCQDPDKLPTFLLNMRIIDKNYKIRDSLIVYKEVEDWEISGLINPGNGKIFIRTEQQALIYRVNSNLKFEIEKERSNIKSTTDYLEKDLEMLNWTLDFTN